MKYSELSAPWQRVFALAWESVCAGSRAIGAVIADDAGMILSEGRNRTGERGLPNPSAVHAETEAIRALNTAKYPDKKRYTLYAGLEPCVMCMGTLVMGGIRRVEIGARDDFGGAMRLIDQFDFARRKGIQITWRDDALGDMQRALQTVRELLYQQDAERLDRMLTDFSVHNKAGVDAAKSLVADGYFQEKSPAEYTADDIFDALMQRIEVQHGL